MTISAERREAIDRQLKTGQKDDLTAQELRALLSDSAWRERVEPQMRELASRLEYCDEAVQLQFVQPIGRELRAIVDTGRGDG